MQKPSNQRSGKIRSKMIPGKYILEDAFIQKVTPKIQRAGEGSAVLLRDGSILLAYSQFAGRSDQDDACIVKRISKDSGITWSAPVILQEKSGKEHLNVMSASLLRLQTGRIVFAFLDKFDARNFVPYTRHSDDEGKTWTEPIPMEKSENGYYSINNDRLYQLLNGRILLPFNQYEFTKEGKRNNGKCGVFYSDDSGLTWEKSICISIRKENIMRPLNMAADKEDAWQRIITDGIQNQEPGIIELKDGRLMMWVRTCGGYMYKAISSDKGISWSPLKPVPSIIVPLSPQSIKRLPDSSRLICIYNDHRDYVFAEEPRWSWRTPLTIATSDNEGETWQHLGELEDDHHNYCYTSILFIAGKMLISYYVSENKKRKDGSEERRNLASLKIKLMDIKAFI